MELNESALTQVLFLDSVLAGFGLAIAAQLALEKDPDPGKHRIAMDLMRSSLFAILSFLSGITTLMAFPSIWQGFLKAVVANTSFFFLVIATVYFVRSIGELATAGFGLEPTWVVRFIIRWTVGILAVAAVYTAIIFLATVAGYLPA